MIFPNNYSNGVNASNGMQAADNNEPTTLTGEMKMLSNTVVPKALFDKTGKMIVKMPEGVKAVNKINTKLLNDRQDMFNINPLTLDEQNLLNSTQENSFSKKVRSDFRTYINQTNLNATLSRLFGEQTHFSNEILFKTDYDNMKYLLKLLNQTSKNITLNDYYGINSALITNTHDFNNKVNRKINYVTLIDPFYRKEGLINQNTYLNDDLIYKTSDVIYLNMLTLKPLVYDMLLTMLSELTLIKSVGEEKNILISSPIN
jgi:hypothetical protein